MDQQFEDDMKMADDIIAKIDNLQTVSVSLSEREQWQKEAFKQAYINVYKTAFTRQMVSNIMEKGEFPDMPRDPMMKKLIEQQADNNIIKSPYMLITVNVYPDLEFEQLEKKVKKFINRKFVSAFLYAYEVRKEDLTGLHCHMLIHYSCKPYDVKRSAKSTFKDCCNVNHPEILNFKFVSIDNLQSKIDYVKGNKKDSKMKAMDYTHTFQGEHILSPWYESTPPLSCRGAEEIPVLN